MNQYLTIKIIKKKHYLKTVEWYILSSSKNLQLLHFMYTIGNVCPPKILSIKILQSQNLLNVVKPADVSYMMTLRTLPCYINKKHENTITKFQGISWWPREDAVAMGAALLAIEHNTWNWLTIMHASWIKYTKNERIGFLYKTVRQYQNGVRHQAAFSIAPIHLFKTTTQF